VKLTKAERWWIRFETPTVARGADHQQGLVAPRSSTARPPRCSALCLPVVEWPALGLRERSKILDLCGIGRQRQTRCWGSIEAGGTTQLLLAAPWVDELMTGLQGDRSRAATLSVRDFGECRDAPVFRTRVIWYVGFAVHATAGPIARLY